MSETNKAHAPYNFVPFHAKSNSADGRKTERVCIRYENVDRLPKHSRLDPALKTGEIHLTLTAETPVFISGGEDGHFYRGADDRLMIPGSTVRGMLRQNVQILGYGTVRPGEDIEDQRLFFRVVYDGAKGKTSPGKTTDPLNDVYQKVIGKNGSDRIPQRVEAGYLCLEDGKYRIYPASKPIIRISRKDIRLNKSGFSDKFNQMVSLDARAVQAIAPSAGNGTRGVLLCPGRPAKPPGSVYLFPTVDWDAVPQDLSNRDKLAYEFDLENRRSVLGEAGFSFRELPKTGRDNAKPVFYVKHSDGHTYFGMTSHPRIGYDHSLADGLPEQDNGAADGVDYPHALFGFCDGDLAYRSRVSVGDFPAADGAKEGEPVSLILGQPKPSWYPGYVVDGKHYNSDGFSLRGFKLYWQKEAKLPPDAEGKDSVKTKMRPLPVPTHKKRTVDKRPPVVGE